MWDSGFGSGAVAHYKSIIKLQFYLLFFNILPYGSGVAQTLDSATCALAYIGVLPQEFCFDKYVNEKLVCPADVLVLSSRNSQHLLICFLIQIKLISTPPPPQPLGA